MILIELIGLSRQETSSLVNNGKSANIVAAKNGYTNGNASTVQQNTKQERGKPMRQILAAFVGNIGTINTGFAFGFSAVVIPQLKQPDSAIPIDDSQASWVGKY